MLFWFFQSKFASTDDIETLLQTTSTKKPTLMSDNATNIDIDETTTQEPELEIQKTTVKPADINLIPNTVVFFYLSLSRRPNSLFR